MILCTLLNFILYLYLEKAGKKSLRQAKIEIQKYQNFFCWVTAKAVLRVKFIRINTYIKKKRSEINNQTLYLKKLEKEQIKCKVSGRNEGNNENQSENRHHKDDRKKSMKLRLTFLKRQN